MGLVSRLSKFNQFLEIENFTFTQENNRKINTPRATSQFVKLQVEKQWNKQRNNFLI